MHLHENSASPHRTAVRHLTEHLKVSLRVGAWGAETLACHALEGSEQLNDLYELAVDTTSEHEPHRLEAMVGEPARLTFELNERRRIFHGIVAALRCGGRRGSQGVHRWMYTLEIAPRAWLATRRRSSRVFEDRRVDEIIRTILAIYRIPSRWHIEQELPRKPYTTQYEETDWEFVRRLAGDHGLSLYFEQPDAIDDDLFALPVSGVAGEVVGAVAGAVGSAVGAAIGIDPIAAMGPLREVVVFTDTARGYSTCGPPRPWDVVTGAVGMALGRAGVGGPVADVVNEVVGKLGDHLAEAFDEHATLHYRPTASALHHDHENSALSFVDRRVITAERAVYRHYDPRRPRSSLHVHAEHESKWEKIGRALEGHTHDSEAWRAAAEEAGKAAAEQLGEQLGERIRGGRGEGEQEERGDRPLEMYDHHGRSPEVDWHYEEDEPERMLRRAVRRHHVASGTTICPWLSVGHRFRLVGHDVESLSGVWTPTSVRHRITAPGESSEGGEIYQNEVECVPADVPYPVAPAERRFVHAIQTAEVVGAGEIATNEHAQIKVRFHWDREGHSSCWLRVMQPWAGAAWGAQFIPRVGSEVVVGYQGGDPDMPLVLGSVYNGVNPPPFNLPEEKTKSGFRTRTTPGGDGAKRNELYFDDAAGEEKVFIRAQRNMELDVQRDRSARIGHDDRTTVEGERHLSVERNAEAIYHQERVLTVHGNQRSLVEGNRRDTTTGARSERIEGDRQLVVEGCERRELQGSTTLVAHGNVVERVAGSHTLVVGGSEGSRAAVVKVNGDLRGSATETVELRADTMLVLRCGKSVLRMGPERIEISSPTVVVSGEDARLKAAKGKLNLKADSLIQGMADKILMAGSGAAVSISSEVSADGSQILLNSPVNAVDPVEQDDDEPTIIELVDQNGQPIANHPFRIVFDDGSELGGALDDEGRAELDLEKEGEICFPGLGEVEPQ